MLNRIAIADDDPTSMEAMVFAVAALQKEPIPMTGKYSSIDTFVKRVKDSSDAALLDHRLEQGDYAAFTGAEAAVKLFKGKIPSVLCTGWTRADAESMRMLRRYIPVILQPDQLEGDALLNGWSTCQQEFVNQFSPERRPWRSLVRVEDTVATGRRLSVYAVIPAWDSDEVVRFLIPRIPGRYERKGKIPKRFFAMVNIGADDQDELYLSELEL